MMDFTYSVERRPKRKTASISVFPDNRVSIIVPELLSDEQINAIISRKAAWIRGKIKFNSEVKYPFNPKEYVSGESFSYLGRNYRLKIMEGDPQDVLLVNGRFVAYAPATLSAEERTDLILESLTKWYQSRGLRKLTDRTAFYARRMNLSPAGVKLKEMRTQWGSCTKDGVVSFNWKIVIAPISIIDYVVVHELCHLVHHNHSDKYWKLLESVMPDCKERKEWLRVNGSLLTLE